ncbi:CRISPR-associated endonuclease Cas1 [Halothiobacillus diazotrophicus]|uniref:CRISPR-associated endonuclease Cas1 n=1 Tax=Halothiobacillus diazotrophicus TaxID=1860122 RepID=A0A191ZFN7_9GAMM|nr:CRISPR-associated endonuclease Cas1 [Halothiobacillus diazotrophicus]ANJ66667.1 CRISPR-associated endonuclease Cas1 [Halothiobacillus diazotrophicus]
MLLVVDRKAVALSLEGESVRVTLAEGGFRRVPLNLLSQVVVQGTVPVASDVYRALAERGIGAVLLAGRGHQAPAFAGAGLTNFVGWRLRQYAAYFDAHAQRQMVRALLHMKLSVCAAAATMLPAEHSGRAHAAQSQALIQLAEAREVDSMRGIEGAAAAAWYSALGKAIDPIWGFSGRNRRPPRDPVNALLSLGYTLATATMANEVIAQGLDPALGFLHAPAPNRAALSLDLVEPLRALVDVFVLGLLSDFSPGDFSVSDQDGCRLSKAARSQFYRRWQVASGSAYGMIHVVLGQGQPVVDADVGLQDVDNPAAGVSLAAACRLLVAHFRRALPDAG